MSLDSEVNADSIAKEWLSAFASATSENDLAALSSLFVAEGYFRDLLTFSWDFRTIKGRAQIEAFLADKLPSRQPTKFQIDVSSNYLVPTVDETTPGPKSVVAAFTFETNDALGRGSVRLVRDPGSNEDASEWKAISVLTAVEDWKGFNDVSRDIRAHDKIWTWTDELSRRRKIAESNPEVLIVGGGQAGLQTAACLSQLGISNLVVEKEARIGDNWRQRYPTLKLHVSRAYCQLLYQQFPSTWPKYTPKDKLADWLEQYAVTQDLFVWTSSIIENNPRYDEETKKWDVIINRDGHRFTLHPSHLVMALSTFGDGIAPTIPGQKLFEGSQVHSSRFRGGAAYSGQNVLVVGAGNSASDICVDLVGHNAKSVTMLQRSATCVPSRKFVNSLITALFPENVPVAVTDFKTCGTPTKLMLETMRGMQPMIHEHDKAMRENLEKAGFKLTDGPGGSGFVELGFTRGGGSFFDSGCASLISNGSVKVKQGVEIARMSENSVVFSDGSELEVDAVVFATGFETIRVTYRRMLGASIVDKTSEIWGLDEEGEVKGVYRPTGQPGLWYAAGDFSFSRTYARRLALLIKAGELGLYKY
ncbi:hypothetical protein M0805_003559 [Coniferiporia weirii]|nr:hypothetical protein M0805_003559 [Coniferiporia weirii]